MKFRATDIRAAMMKQWAAPEWAIMLEVGEGTGANSGRYADAVMMSLWPSRGLELHGVEIKVSRSDWKREAADPSKAEAIAKYCDRWWIHTPPGIVADLSELPPSWGLREFDGKRWKTKREAEKTEALPVSRAFLAAMLRRADGAVKALVKDAMRDAEEAQSAEAEKRRGEFRKNVEDAVARRLSSYERRLANAAAFEAAFKPHLRNEWSVDPVAWGNAAKALADCGGRYGNLSDRLRKAADEIDALADLSKPKPEPDWIGEL